MYTKYMFAAFAAGSMVVLPMIAGAHQRELYTIGGTDYLMVVGSLAEPIVVDDKTGLDLRVMKADPSDPTNASGKGVSPVTGLEATLKLELIAGDKKKIQDIAAAYGTPGSYKTTFFPTIPTTLTYRVFGTINNTPVDLSFTCNPAGIAASPEDKTEIPMGDNVVRKFKAGQFGCPQSKAEFGFPELSMSMHEVHMDAEHHMMGAMEHADARTKEATASGTAFGLLGVLLGSIALWKTRKPKL